MALKRPNRKQRREMARLLSTASIRPRASKATASNGHSQEELLDLLRAFNTGEHDPVRQSLCDMKEARSDEQPDAAPISTAR